MLAAGFLSYAVVLGADGPMGRLAFLESCMSGPRAVHAGSGPPQRDERAALYLVRSTLMALDDAHRTGNYAVLRGLASPMFQTANTVERVAAAFAVQRRQEVDLSVAALESPEWSEPPVVGADNLLRMSGGYRLEAGGALRFSLVFAASDGAWRVHEIHVGRSPNDGPVIQAAGLR